MFISHVQGEAGMHVLALREAIVAARPSARPWIDLDEDATTDGMLRGVAQSRAIIICVTPHILARQWCQFEVKQALEARTASRGAVPIVFVAINGCTIAAAVEAGRVFSADESARRDGKVSLNEADFAALVEAHEERPAIVFLCDERLTTETVPHVFAACGIEPVVAAAVPANATDRPFRLRRALPDVALGCDILLVASPNGAVQCSFLHTALGRMCARRALVIRTLDCNASPNAARAAIAGARHVVCVLTDKMWGCLAVREAMEARSPHTKVTLLHETDTRACFGGVQNFGDLLDQRPAALASLFDDHMARVFERKKEKRTIMLEQLLRDAGAVASDSSGGSCPPPHLPHGYREEAVLGTLTALEAALLDAPGTLAVATGGMGGAGKTTVATALATQRLRVRGAFDDVLWVSLGSQVKRLELLTAVMRVVHELEEASEGIGIGRNAEREVTSYDTVESATRRLRELLATRRMLVIVDDACTIDHFLAFLGAVSSSGGGRQAPGLHGSKLLFTTRDIGHFTRAVASVRLVDACVAVPFDPLSAEAARDFVASAAGIPPRRAAALNLAPIFAAIGTTPLALSIVSGVMRTKLEPLNRIDCEAEVAVVDELIGMLGRGGDDINSSCRWINQPLFHDSLATLTPGFESYMPLYLTIDLALRSQFGESDALDFAALSLFPKGRPISESLVRVAWRADRERTRTLLVALQGAGLLKFELKNAAADSVNDTAEDGLVMLHDLALDFATGVVAMQPGGEKWAQSQLFNRSRSFVFVSPTNQLHQPSGSGAGCNQGRTYPSRYVCLYSLFSGVHLQCCTTNLYLILFFI